MSKAELEKESDRIAKLSVMVCATRSNPKASMRD